MDWRGFELHPETPPGGIALERYFGAGRAEQMDASMKGFAAQHGIADFRHPRRIPNTRRALALAEVAREEGKIEPFRTRAMDAHWRDGLDLESGEDLAAIAREAALAPDAVERSTSDPRYLRRVDAMREEANGIGVTGIPTVILGRYRVTGCQPYETFEELVRRAGVARRDRPSS